jgi:hypothetical protein
MCVLPLSPHVSTGPTPTFQGSSPSLVNLSANFLMGAIPDALRTSAACGKVVDLSNNLLSVSTCLDWLSLKVSAGTEW